MTQLEFDQIMHQISSEQSQMHREKDAEQQAIRDKIADINKQILDLKKITIDLQGESHRIAQERFRLDQEFKQRRHEFVVDHPKSSMEPETPAENA